MIGEAQLKLMKPSAYLINTARGPIVNESVLIRALQEGWIAGAALDVFEQEPIEADNPLLALDNVLLAPHAIGWTEEIALGSGTHDCLGILRVMRGEIPDNVVNREVLDQSVLCQKLARYQSQFGG